jgi:hypothetical protein
MVLSPFIPVTLPDYLKDASLAVSGPGPTSSSVWVSLGFDVADGDLLSGIMNCGIDQRDMRNSRRQKLNDYSLFNDFESADAFRSFSDRRVQEHAPFYVYRLSVLLEKEGCLSPADFLRELGIQ